MEISRKREGLILVALAIAVVTFMATISSLGRSPAQKGIEKLDTVAAVPPDAVFFSVGDVLIFLDDRYPPDEGTSGATAVNRVAFVVHNYDALYLEDDPAFGPSVRRIPANKISELQNLTARVSPLREYADQVATYFEKYINDPLAFRTGMAALFYNNKDLFVRDELAPEFPKYRNDEERESAWKKFVSSLHPGDRILEFNHSSIISHVIALVTHGPWSHLAVYIGDGEISEIVTSGVRRASIEIYKASNYSLAAYRYIDALDRAPTRAEAIEEIRWLEEDSSGYSYFGAIRAGWIAFWGDFVDGLVPNSVIYLGTAILIAQY